jgi:hypothetical protein
VLRDRARGTEPVYVPCHNSTFNAADGGRLAGPAPRGLYRFRVTSVTDATVEIAEVEEDVRFSGSALLAFDPMPKARESDKGIGVGRGSRRSLVVIDSSEAESTTILRSAPGRP